MTIGSSDDMLARLKSLVPSNWFTFVSPVRDAVLGGVAGSLAWNFTLLAVSKAQSRLATASGYFLDIAGYDFLDLDLLRRENEEDERYRARVQAEIFRPRVTIPAIKRALTDLTGETPDVFEPWNVGGGYGCGALAYGGGVTNAPAVDGYGAPIGGYGVGALSYGVPSGVPAKLKGAGFYGSIVLPYQIFITVYRPRLGANPNVAGYGITIAGYGAGAIEYATAATSADVLSDDEIYACVEDTIAGGITAWVTILDTVRQQAAANAPPVIITVPVMPPAPGSLDFSIPGNPFLALL